MATFLAYPVAAAGDDVEFRVVRRHAGRLVPLPPDLCRVLAERAGGSCRIDGAGGIFANAQGVRGLRRWFVVVHGDRPAIYGADGEPYETVCDAVRTVLGFVPGGTRCGAQ